jgi:NTE family protein
VRRRRPRAAEDRRLLPAVALLAFPILAGQGAPVRPPAPPAAEASPSAPAPARAQDGPRPKVVLVLGGDGAYGLANVGVLAALEELHIPVDAIVGSGTGALVGGLYAVGNSTDRLKKALSSLDWDEALLDRTPREHLSYRRKVDDREFLVDVSVGFGKGGFRLPRSVFAGKRWTLFIETLALPSVGAPTFDDLEIPFRAVATDLETGQPVVLAHGDLASSLRASSSLPGLFPPIEIEGRLLTDGVLSNSLPIDIAPDLGADVAIAVELDIPLAEKESIHSYIDVGEQILRLREIEARKRARAALDSSGRPGDVHLVLGLHAHSLLSHFAALAIAAEGRVAVLAQKERLAHLALDPAAWEEHLRQRKARTKPWPVLGGVRIASAAPVAPEVVRERIQSPVGEPIDPETLHQDFSRVFGLDLYDDVGFHLEEKDGSSDLVVDTRQKESGPWSLRFGASSQADLTGGNGITLGALLVRRPVNELGAEWRNRVQFGPHSILGTEFIQPLAFGSPFFVAPRVFFERERVAVTSGNDTLAEFDVESLQEGLDLGYVLGDWGEIRAGLFHESGRSSLAVGDPNTFEDSNFDQGGTIASVAYDTLDSTGFPRMGSIGKTEFQGTLDALGGTEDAQSLSLKHDSAFSFGANSLVLGGEFDTALKNELAVQNQFPLGGFLRLSGLAPNELAGSHAVLARVVGYHHFGFKAGWRAPVSIYLGGSLETGNVFAARDDIKISNLRMGGSVFAGCDSFLGPMFLGVGVAEGGETNVFVILGSIY